MEAELTLLIATAASLGLIHTILGPDHYLPFIMMSKAGDWSKRKTVLVTFFCGIGHVASSILIGAIGIVFGISIENIQYLEAFRGNIAAWLLTGFGMAYFIWGVRNAVLNRSRKHLHIYQDGEEHSHHHIHRISHLHNDQKTKKLTPWVLFVIFAFGPCEPLIPLLLYPAAYNSWLGIVAIAIVFCIFTLVTMIAMVMVPLYGISLFPFQRLERYSHAIAGATVCLCGFGMLFLGL
ncbi:MAG: sulfite exporter TauE/SafE family protein [Marinifilaceae bacterium]